MNDARISIGSVTYAGGSVVAELWGVDEWTVRVFGRESPGMARGLRARYGRTYKGPSDGHYGQLILRELADRTGGEMSIRAFPVAGPGEIP